MLKAPDETNLSYFGCSVAIDGDTAVVGAYGHLGLGVRLRVHARRRRLDPAAAAGRTGAQPDGLVRCHIRRHGDRRRAGATTRRRRTPGPTPGAARVYTRTGGVWSFQQQLEAGDGGGQRPFRLVRRARRRQRRDRGAVQERRHPQRRRRGLRVHAVHRRLVPAAEGRRRRGRQPRPVGRPLRADGPGGRARFVQRHGLGHRAPGARAARGPSRPSSAPPTRSPATASAGAWPSPATRRSSEPPSGRPPA